MAMEREDDMMILSHADLKELIADRRAILNELVASLKPEADYEEKQASKNKSKASGTVKGKQKQQTVARKKLKEAELQLGEIKHLAVALMGGGNLVSAPREKQNDPKDDYVRDMVELMYVGKLLDTRDASARMLSRAYERSRCMSYMVKGGEDTEAIGSRDFDSIVTISNMCSSSMVPSLLHSDALANCVGYAKEWITSSDAYIPYVMPPTTYAHVMAKFKKIMHSGYINDSPSTRANVDFFRPVNKLQSGKGFSALVQPDDSKSNK